MGKFWLTLIIFILLLVVAAGIYLMSIDIEPPTEQIEKTLPDDRFPK